jgi:hypothetical protein
VIYEMLRQVRAAAAVLLVAGVIALLSRGGDTARAGGITFEVNQAENVISQGDGTCDETCTIRDAIMAANVSGDHDTIVFDPEVFAEGSGNENIIYPDPLPLIDGSDGLTIDGTGAVVSLYGFELQSPGPGLFFRTPAFVGINDIVVRNIAVDSFESGIEVCSGEVGSDCTDFVSGIEIENVVAQQNTELGISVRGGTVSDVTIAESEVKNNNLSAVEIYGGAGVSGVVFDGNDVNGTDFTAVQVLGGAGGLEDIQFTDNEMRGTNVFVDAVGPVDQVALERNHSGDARTVGMGVGSDSSTTNVTIALNEIYNSSGRGIFVGSAQSPQDGHLSNVVVENNLVSGSSDTGIIVRGAAGPGQNVVAANTVSSGLRDGILVQDADNGPGTARVTLSRNQTYSNGQLGIDLSPLTIEANPGVTLNDAGDTDIGPNALLNFPEFSTPSGYAFAFGEACANCLIEVFESDNDPSGYGEALEFILDLRAGPDGNFILPLCGLGLSAGEKIAATATDPQGNTSELSENYTLLEDSEPCPSATPTPTASPTATPTATPARSPTVTPTPSASPSPTATATAGPGEFTWGDHNCANGPDPIDALLTLRHDAGLGANTGDCPEFGAAVPASGPALTWGDVDCDGQISPIDGLKLLRHDAGLPVQVEEGCPEIGDSVG